MVDLENPRALWFRPWLDLVHMCRYVSYEDKKLGGAKRQNEMVINRKKPHPSIPGQTVSIPYRVTDQPLKLNVQEWYVSV